MAEPTDNALADMLDDGWAVVGYSVCLMAMGATSHHVLLQKGNHLTTHTIVTNAGEELGRGMIPISPKPPKKKGWFG